MGAASTGAQAAAGNLSQIGQQNNQFGTDANNALFGTYKADMGRFQGGTLSNFMDPNSLNVSAPTGPYKLQYQKFLEGNSKDYANARGSLNRELAQRGFGDHPSGIAADEYRKLAQGQADTQGQGFVDYAGKSYEDALNNFWKANSMLSDAGSQGRQLAVAGNQAAAGTYTNLYNTASQPRPSAVGQIIGGGLQAGGNIASAGITANAKNCPVEGSLILMADGEEKFVEELKKNDLVMGIDGEPCFVLRDPQPSYDAAIEISSDKGKCRVSSTHEFMLSRGGYVIAEESHGAIVEWNDESAVISGISLLGRKRIFKLELDGSHTYRTDKYWSLS
jgi:hypothetical protein